MRSIKARFKIIEKRHPEWSSYTNFANAICEQNFCKDRLYRNFNKLVETEDYNKEEKNNIQSFLFLLTKMTRRTEIRY
jgi:hypothetical protein